MQSVVLFYVLIIAEQWKSGWRFTVKIPIHSNIYRLQQKPGIQFASVLVFFSLSVSGLTLVGVRLPHNSCGEKLGSSHRPRLVSGPGANTCLYYSQRACDASSHSFTRLPVWWWQLPTHLFTVGPHFLFLLFVTVPAKGTFCSTSRMTRCDYQYPVRLTKRRRRRKSTWIIHY